MYDERYALPPTTTTNWRSKSSLEAPELEPLDLSVSESNSPIDSLSQKRMTNDPPKTFQDMLPPQLITTSTLSEAGYMGYRKSKSIFKSTRSSTFPPPQTPTSGTLQPLKLSQPKIVNALQPLPSVVTTTTIKQRNYPSSTSRRSTLKKMKGMMNTLKRSISSINDSRKKKSRPPIPSSSAFGASSSQSRFGTGSGRQSYRRQDSGYLNLSDEDAVGAH